MKSFYKLTAVLGLSFAIAACAEAGEDGQEAGSDTAAATTQPAAAPAAAPTDPEIAHIAKTANDADIDGGNLASQKAENAEVKGFAKLMVTDHTAMNQQGEQAATAAQVTPQDNPTSQQMMSEHQTAKQQLEGQSGAAFDRAYIQHEVQMHQKVLDALDRTLIPNAQNAQLKQTLTDARAKVQAHLQRAQEIQGKLGQ